MTTKSKLLPYPNESVVLDYIHKFNQKYYDVERTLTKLFSEYPENTILEDVYVKVIVLNALYYTSIWDSLTVAKHIVSLKIDATIRKGNIEAVDKIAQVKFSGKIWNLYSFSTKYCSWHNPKAYAIYDGYVDSTLWRYKNQYIFDRFFRKDLKNYSRFIQIIDKFRSYFNLISFDRKDTDKYLWLVGQE